jgi:hypothetical protein
LLSVISPLRLLAEAEMRRKCAAAQSSSITSIVERVVAGGELGLERERQHHAVAVAGVRDAQRRAALELAELGPRAALEGARVGRTPAPTPAAPAARRRGSGQSAYLSLNTALASQVAGASRGGGRGQPKPRPRVRGDRPGVTSPKPAPRYPRPMGRRRDPNFHTGHLCRFCGALVPWGEIVRLIRTDPDTPPFMLCEKRLPPRLPRGVLRPGVALAFARHWPAAARCPTTTPRSPATRARSAPREIAPPDLVRLRAQRPTGPVKAPRSTSSRSRSTSSASPGSAPRGCSSRRRKRHSDWVALARTSPRRKARTPRSSGGKRGVAPMPPLDRRTICSYIN